MNLRVKSLGKFCKAFLAPSLDTSSNKTYLHFADEKQARGNQGMSVLGIFDLSLVGVG